MLNNNPLVQMNPGCQQKKPSTTLHPDKDEWIWGGFPSCAQGDEGRAPRLEICISLISSHLADGSITGCLLGGGFPALSESLSIVISSFMIH